MNKLYERLHACVWLKLVDCYPIPKYHKSYTFFKTARDVRNIINDNVSHIRTDIQHHLIHNLWIN